MKEYIVLHDGREVAGRRNPGIRKRIMLTDAEAKHPLRIGHIRLPTAEDVEKSKAKK